MNADVLMQYLLPVLGMLLVVGLVALLFRRKPSEETRDSPIGKAPLFDLRNPNTIHKRDWKFRFGLVPAAGVILIMFDKCGPGL